jgi:hypothetical protein
VGLAVEDDRDHVAATFFLTLARRFVQRSPNVRAVVVLVACVGCSEYVQHRAAFVPHPTPIATTGQPQSTLAKFSIGAPVLGDLGSPTAGSTPAAGIGVPSHQLRGALSFAPTENLTLSVAHEQGLRGSATNISSTVPELPDRNVLGYGFGIAYSIPTTAPGMRVGLATELTVWSSPWVAYTTDTNDGTTVVDRGASNVATLGVAVTPSYRVGPVTVFGGATLRNHPTLDEKVHQEPYSSPPEVQMGPLNATLAAGVAYAYEAFELGVEVHQTIHADPVSYGPSIGLWIAFGGGQKPTRRARERARAARLMLQAADAARADRCDVVQVLGRSVFDIDADFYANVFLRDIAIERCIKR